MQRQLGDLDFPAEVNTFSGVAKVGLLKYQSDQQCNATFALLRAEIVCAVEWDDLVATMVH